METGQARHIDQIFPEDCGKLYEGIRSLSDELKGYKDVKLIGIYLDGVPVSRAVKFLMSENRFVSIETETVLISSSRANVMDAQKIWKLKNDYPDQTRVYVDRRTKTGKLGDMLKRCDSDAVYAVVEDKNGHADVCGSREEVPWFNWPGGKSDVVRMVKKTAPIVGVDVKIDEKDKTIAYEEILSLNSIKFYAQFLGGLTEEISPAFQS